MIYILFVLLACGLFARFWVEISGESAKDVAKKLKDQKVIFAGHREQSMYSIL